MVFTFFFGNCDNAPVNPAVGTIVFHKSVLRFSCISEKSGTMFGEDVLFQTPIQSMVIWSGGWALGGFITCIVTSLLLHGDGATHTHCGVSYIYILLGGGHIKPRIKPLRV